MTLSPMEGRCRRQIARTRGLAPPDRCAWGLGFVASVLLGLSGAGIVYGAPGDLDPTFGARGVAISFGPTDHVNVVAQQPDGKLVVAGTSLNQIGGSIGFILLVRYLPDGRGDPTFGAGGKVTIAVGSSSSATALVVQPDGKLVVAGSTTVGLASPTAPSRRIALLARIQPDGHLDASFGANGIVTTDLGAGAVAKALLLPPDGTIVVGGTWAPGVPDPGIPFLARYQADGRLDASFGTGGVVTDIFPPGVYTMERSGIVRHPDGTLVMAAGSGFFSPADLSVVRLLPDGQRDATFGVGGLVTIDIGIFSGGQTSSCSPIENW